MNADIQWGTHNLLVPDYSKAVVRQTSTLIPGLRVTPVADGVRVQADAWHFDSGPGPLSFIDIPFSAPDLLALPADSRAVTASAVLSANPALGSLYTPNVMLGNDAAPNGDPAAVNVLLPTAGGSAGNSPSVYIPADKVIALAGGANPRIMLKLSYMLFSAADMAAMDFTVTGISVVAQEASGGASPSADVLYRDPADQKFKPLTTLMVKGFPAAPGGIDPATAKIEWGTESFIEFDWAKATVVESTYPPEANLRAVPEANGVRFKWDTFNATLKWSGGFMATVKEGPYASYEVPIRLRPGHSVAGNGRGIRVKANVDVPANMASATVNAISGVGAVTPVAGTSSMVPKQVWATIVNTPQPDYKAPLAADLWTAVVDELATPAPRMRGVLPGSVGFGVYGPALPVYTSAIVSGKPLTNAGGADETTVVTIVAGEMYVHDFGAITQEVVAP